jgi:hypothetical protein
MLTRWPASIARQGHIGVKGRRPEPARDAPGRDPAIPPGPAE